MPFTWENVYVCVLHCAHPYIYICMYFDELQPFSHLFNILLRLAQPHMLTLLYIGGCSTLTGGKRIMYLLPLFKSLMQEVHSHMIQREQEREGAYMCGGIEILVLLCSNKGFHRNYMHHLSPYQNSWMKCLNYPSFSCTHTHTHTLNFQSWKGITTFDWESLCTNGTAVCWGAIWESWSLGCLSQKRLLRMGDSGWLLEKKKEKETLSLSRQVCLKQESTKGVILLQIVTTIELQLQLN